MIAVDDALGRRPKRPLAFDHDTILATGVEHVRAMLETTTIATAFVAKTFTPSDLRAVYEAAWDQSLDPGNFRRKVLVHPRLRQTERQTRHPQTRRRQSPR